MEASRAARQAGNRQRSARDHGGAKPIVDGLAPRARNMRPR
jgi:hypothetical protein